MYMDSNFESKEINIKWLIWYYFDDIIKFEGFNLDNILIYEKSYQSILDYNILCKNLIGAKPLHIRLDKMDGFIRVFDGTRYLVLFECEKYDFIHYNRTRYLIGVKSGIRYVISHKLQKSWFIRFFVPRKNIDFL